MTGCALPLWACYYRDDARNHFLSLATSRRQFHLALGWNYGLELSVGALKATPEPESLNTKNKPLFYMGLGDPSPREVPQTLFRAVWILRVKRHSNSLRLASGKRLGSKVMVQGFGARAHFLQVRLQQELGDSVESCWSSATNGGMIPTVAPLYPPIKQQFSAFPSFRNNKPTTSKGLANGKLCFKA